MKVYSYAPGGYHGHIVTVEVDCRTGIPGMDIVGLPASEVREARDRARVAIRNSGFVFPARRILVSLSPADVPKHGNGFDLALAAALLDGELGPALPAAVLMVGELHLDGAVGEVRGVLAAVAEGVEAGIPAFCVPATNREEAAAVSAGRSVGIPHLRDLPDALGLLATGRRELLSAHPLASTGGGTPPVAETMAARQSVPGADSPGPARALVAGPANTVGPAGSDKGAGARSVSAGPASASVRGAGPAPATGVLDDYGQLRGLADLKRALEIAAAGGHHLIVVGPPGAGKSAALTLFPTILPPLDQREAIEVTRIHSLAAEPGRPAGLFTHRPFRAPHHTTSVEGLLGGRLPEVPGEVALAHSGTLFLDEALEFRRPVLQGLREPLEYGRVRVARARGNYWFPARIQLLLATNRCPCGMLGREDRICICSLNEVDRYWRRLGGPLLDRIDLRVQVAPRPVAELPATDSSAAMRDRAIRAVRFRMGERAQRARNVELGATRVRRASRLTPAAERAYANIASAWSLSARASISVLRVARTIGDLAGSERVTEEHVLEAASYRRYGELYPLWESDRSGA